MLETILFRYGWVLFILVTSLNGAVWWRRGRKYIGETPTLAPGYQRLICGWLIFGNLPWVVMGFGIFYGGLSGTQRKGVTCCC